MIDAEQARRDLQANLASDNHQELRKEAKRREAELREIARAVKEDVPKMLADIETKIYEAIAARQSDIKYSQSASPAINACFDALKNQLETHGYNVTKDYNSGTTDYSDDCRNVPYADYILYITWSNPRGN